MTWRPLHNTHAIERVKITVQFTTTVPAKVARQMSDAVFQKRHEHRLTGPTPIQMIDVNLTPGETGQVVNRVDGGWQYTRTSSNGLPLEAIILNQNTLSYETSEYQRWEVFKRRLEKFFDGAVSAASHSMDVETLILEYVDRFIFNGPATSANVADLLNGLEHVIPRQALEGKSLWHFHRGWFEEAQGGNILINQNFDAQDGNVLGRQDAKRSIQILTRADLRRSVYPVDIERMTHHLDILHDITKSHFMSALSKDHHSSVGLN